MKHLFPLILILASLFIKSCANQSTPQGGPRDTIPPLLTKSIPENQSINYKAKVFEFEFSEKINADKLSTKLNITPRTENKFKTLSKKNKFVLTFEDEFNDSTTYTFNFADGVGDLTENNPVDNFTFAFSTGSIIDSIYINGRVKNLYNNKVEKNILIAIYDIDDTLDLFTGKPKYFTTTNDSGIYNIENIKNGHYKLYAFQDDNNNLINNPIDEQHGFIQDTLDLNTSIDSLMIKVQLMDASQPKFIRAKNTGQYFDVLYSKLCDRYDLSKIDTLNNLNIPSNNLIKENTVIRFYKDESFEYKTDSLQLLINFYDSLDNHIQDTVFVKFNESKRKASPFEMKIFPTNKNIEEEFTLKIKFDKPIKQFNKDSLTIKYDTIQNVSIPDSILIWNSNKTLLRIQLKLDKKLIPNINEKLKAEATIQDSINALIKNDSVAINESSRLAVKDSSKIELSNLRTISSNKFYDNKINVTLKPMTFLSIDNDTTEVVNISYKFKSEKELGKLRGKITTTNKNYYLQLTDPNYTVIQEIKNPTNFEFNNVEPGKYTFRILIDENNDGVWSPGNILKDIEPESIWFFEEVFDLRANWEVENLDITF